MKKYAFLIATLFYLLGTSASHAQDTFAPVGAEWWYGGSGFDYSFWDDYSIRWVDHMQSIKDTVVAGKPCRLLAAVRYTKNNLSQNAANTAQVRYRDTFYVYDNGDTVFVYDKTIADYTPLYIFNVAAGDTLSLRKPNYSGADATFRIVIDSIKLEAYDTASLRSYYHHTIMNAGLSCFGWGGPKYIPESGVYINSGKYTERIGGNWPKHGSFFPNAIIYNPDYYKESEEIPTGSFRCYYDPGTAIKVVDLPCDSVIKPYLSIPEMTESGHGVSIYPNPANGLYRISLKEPLKEGITLQVTDLAGRTLKTVAFPGKQTLLTLDIRTLSNGLYVLRFRIGDKEFYRKIMLQH